MSKIVAALVATGAFVASMPAVAEEMRAEEARAFVVGNFFSFTCFEGTSGEGRVNADGSVVGTIRLGGSGPRPGSSADGAGRIGCKNFKLPWRTEVGGGHQHGSHNRDAVGGVP